MTQIATYGLGPRPGGSAKINDSKRIYVDEQFGNDSTGLPYRFDKPFATFDMANSIAASEDTIVLRSGGLYFATSTPIRNFGFIEIQTGATFFIFEFEVLNGQILSFGIYGQGSLNISSGIHVAVGGILLLNINVDNVSVSGNGFGLYEGNGDVNIVCREFISSGPSALLVTLNSSLSFNLTAERGYLNSGVTGFVFDGCIPGASITKEYKSVIDVKSLVCNLGAVDMIVVTNCPNYKVRTIGNFQQFAGPDTTVISALGCDIKHNGDLFNNRGYCLYNIGSSGFPSKIKIEGNLVQGPNTILLPINNPALRISDDLGNVKIKGDIIGSYVNGHIWLGDFGGAGSQPGGNLEIDGSVIQKNANLNAHAIELGDGASAYTGVLRLKNTKLYCNNVANKGLNASFATNIEVYGTPVSNVDITPGLITNIIPGTNIIVSNLITDSEL